MFIGDTRDPPSAAQILAAAGLLPFLGALLLMYLGISTSQRALGLDLFVYYGAVIVSFSGGVRWGAALSRPHWQSLMLAVGPPVLALMALLLDRESALNLLAVSFLLVGVFDAIRRADSNWPQWFKRVRSRLTVAVLALHLLAMYLPRPPG